MDLAVIVKTPAELQHILAENPFTDEAYDTKRGFFALANQPLADTAGLAAQDFGEEKLCICPQAAYMYSDTPKASDKARRRRHTRLYGEAAQHRMRLSGIAIHPARRLTQQPGQRLFGKTARHPPDHAQRKHLAENDYLLMNDYRRPSSMQTYTSHEFNQHASEAQKAAQAAPVLITSQGKPDLVLISHAEYARLTGQKNTVSMLEALTPSAELAAKLADIELDISPRSPAQRPPVVFE